MANLIRFTHLSAVDELVHGFSTVPLNLSLTSQAGLASGQQGREVLAQELSLDAHTLVSGLQVHGHHVTLVTSKDQGRGALDPDTRIPDTDALITNQAGVPLLVLVADCAAIYLYDPVHHAIGLVHAGWRGASKDIVATTIAAMSHHFGTQPHHLLAAISPTIGQCCYTVKDDVRQAFSFLPAEIIRQVFQPHPHDGHHSWQFDLQQTITWQLTAAGVPTHQIEANSSCTFDHPQFFHSYRRDQATFGSMAAVMMLR